VLSLLFCVQRLITLPHQPFEHTIEHAFGHGTHRVRDLQFYKICYFQSFLINCEVREKTNKMQQLDVYF